MPLGRADLAEMPRVLPAVCRALVAGDPDIVAIVQFGSSVYAPESALDVDLLVVTRERKDYSLYLDATVEAPCWVDVIPVEVDGSMGWPMVLGVRATSRLLYGDWNIVDRMVQDMAVPTCEEAREELSGAEVYCQMAVAEPEARRREMHFRTAFNTLFDAARLAAMAFLDAERTRWGYLRGQLPPPFDERFRELIDTLHGAYFYRRQLPSGDVEAEYQRWQDTVLQFINDLEAAASPPSS